MCHLLPNGTDGDPSRDGWLRPGFSSQPGHGVVHKAGQGRDALRRDRGASGHADHDKNIRQGARARAAILVDASRQTSRPVCDRDGIPKLSKLDQYSARLAFQAEELVLAGPSWPCCLSSCFRRDAHLDVAAQPPRKSGILPLPPWPIVPCLSNLCCKTLDPDVTAPSALSRVICVPNGDPCSSSISPQDYKSGARRKSFSISHLA